MRVLRLLSVLAVALMAAGASSARTTFASSSLFKRGGEPTCTVTITSTSSSSTTCAGTLSGGGLNDQQWLANVDVAGSAVYQCRDSAGVTVPGQNQVQGDTETSTSFQTTSMNTSFTTSPTVVAAASTISASQAGCAADSTTVDPTLTTTKVTLLLTTPTSSAAATFFVCTASNPNGLRGTVALSC